MELNTSDLVLISRKDYRDMVDKVMTKAMTIAAIGVAHYVVEKGPDAIDRATQAANDGLNLQVDILKMMEDALFGKQKKTEETKKND